MSETQNANFGLPKTKDEEIEALKLQLAAANQKLLVAGVDQIDPSEGVGALDNQGFPKKYVKVQIFPGRDTQDLNYVPLAIGGYALKVTRGIDVILPTVFAEVLEHAVEDVTIKSEGGLVTRPNLRFPYQVKGEATEIEYTAFMAKMRAEGKTAAVSA